MDTGPDKDSKPDSPCSPAESYDGYMKKPKEKSANSVDFDEVRSYYSKKYASFGWGSNAKDENVHLFVESISLLQTTQEALETEIQKIGDIGKEVSLFDDLYSHVEEPEVFSKTTSLEPIQEKELNEGYEASNEQKILELEGIIKQKQLDSGSELESLLENKIKTEIELLFMTRTVQSWKVMTEDQIALSEDQKYYSGQNAEKMKKAEITVMKLKDYCRQLSESEEALKMKNKVCKYSVFFVLQLLLCIVAWFFLLQMLPDESYDVVPT